MEKALKYWIAVASKDHVMRGVQGGFIQVNHGKKAPLARMKQGDKVIIYSPKQVMDKEEKLQAFTAIGEVSDNDIYQHTMTEDFTPFRRNIKFYNCRELPVLPLIHDLDFIENKKSWGYPFRFGFFEIGEKDFALISKSMLKNDR